MGLPLQFLSRPPLGSLAVLLEALFADHLVQQAFALLRAENRSVNPPSSLVDLEAGSRSGTFHRVLWISTPH